MVADYLRVSDSGLAWNHNLFDLFMIERERLLTSFLNREKTHRNRAFLANSYHHLITRRLKGSIPSKII